MALLMVCTSQGSSPLARGTLHQGGGLPGPLGIIPACAGNTRYCPWYRQHVWDHPRLRREHPASQMSPPRSMGSSPLARGTRVVAHPNLIGRGIIPACAGNTYSRPSPNRTTRDHPRLRGEHSQKTPSGDRTTGSSPLARGTHAGQDRIHRFLGIIPACAGNTCGLSPGCGCRGDHPRLRGEHAQYLYSSHW